MEEFEQSMKDQGCDRKRATNSSKSVPEGAS